MNQRTRLAKDSFGTTSWGFKIGRAVEVNTHDTHMEFLAAKMNRLIVIIDGCRLPRIPTQA